MATPTSAEARLFHRCARRRFDDAGVLLRSEHTTGAVYLAGYGVECILKALVLSNLPSPSRQAMLASFRGARAHDHEWLRRQYLQTGGQNPPIETRRDFTLVQGWSTEMRYLPRDIRLNEAQGFLEAVGRIIIWAEGRLS